MDFRKRDAWVENILKVHPCTVSQFVRTRAFSSRQTASRRLSTLRKRLRINLIGTVRLKPTGRPADVFFVGNLREDRIQHEVLLTEFLLFMPCKRVRGKDVDQEILPDATIWLNNQTIHVEMETDNESRVRVGAHKKHNDLVLWITTTELWLESIKEQTTEIHNRCLYTTVGRCTDIWDDAMGRQARVAKLY